MIALLNGFDHHLHQRIKVTSYGLTKERIEGLVVSPSTSTCTSISVLILVTLCDYTVT